MKRNAKILLISDDNEKSFFNKINNIFKNEKSINLICSNSSTNNLKDHMFFDLSMIFIDYKFLKTDIEELLSFITFYLSYKSLVIIFAKKDTTLLSQNIYENALIFNENIDDNFYISTMNMLDILRYNNEIDDVTSLPGYFVLLDTLKEKFENNEIFSLVYIDIDRFKSFTDYYGLTRANELLGDLSHIMISVIGEYDDLLNNVYHVGGDDFALILADDSILDDIYNKLIGKFDELVSKYYDDEDLKKGYVSVLNREGNFEDFSLISLSMVAVTNNFNKYDSLNDMFKDLATLKIDAKQFGGSILLQVD